MELIAQGVEHLEAPMVPLYPSKTGVAFPCHWKAKGMGINSIKKRERELELAI